VSEFDEVERNVSLVYAVLESYIPKNGEDTTAKLLDLSKRQWE